MSMDLTGTIMRFAVPLVLQRRAEGYWDVDGINHVGDVTSVVISAAVQPGANNTKILPEGVRVEDAAIVWTDTRLFDAQDPEGRPADRFTWQGRVFEVARLDDRNADGNGKFWRAIAYRVRDAEDDEA